MLIRFKLIYIDDKMLSPEMAELTGYVSVLTIWEAATGILATKWIPYFGPFTMLGSDSDPALLGDVIKLLSFYMAQKVKKKDKKERHKHKTSTNAHLKNVDCVVLQYFRPKPSSRYLQDGGKWWQELILHAPPSARRWALSYYL